MTASLKLDKTTGGESHSRHLPPNRLPPHDFFRDPFDRATATRERLNDLKEVVSLKLQSAGLPDHAGRLDACGTKPVFLVCSGCRLVRRVLNHCDRHFCPCCQPGLARKRERQIGWWASELEQPKHMVLTVANIPDADLNRGYIDWLRDCFASLRRLKLARNWSGFYSVQVTNSGNGFHVHLHCVVEVRFIDLGQLQQAWSRLTDGAGQIVKVLDIRQPDRLARTIRYVVKPSELASWTPSQIATFVRAFEGVKTFSTFGDLWSMRTRFAAWVREIRDLSRTCPCCGCLHRRFYTEADFHRLNPLIRPPWLPIPPPHPPPPLGFDLGSILESELRPRQPDVLILVSRAYGSVGNK
jgi:hypothetical protein